MASPQTRSAALLISVYVDVETGAPWYAMLRGFDDPASPESWSQRVSDTSQLIVVIQRWLTTVLDET